MPPQQLASPVHTLSTPFALRAHNTSTPFSLLNMHTLCFKTHLYPYNTHPLRLILPKNTLHILNFETSETSKRNTFANFLLIKYFPSFHFIPFGFCLYYSFHSIWFGIPWHMHILYWYLVYIWFSSSTSHPIPSHMVGFALPAQRVAPTTLQLPSLSMG